MASKKDKLLENAQRFVLKGQIDKAIKEYQQIVALDPREIRFRQRLAELLVRDNRKEEAIAEYADIGKHYAENSYFLKAIAVYKQIQRLDPANPEVAHTLASLNQRQGLTGNALAEYNHTLRLLEQQGNLPQAVKVVKEMLSLDGENGAILLKHAELLYATGQHEPSYHAFSELFRRLVQGGDDAAAERVSQRMAELFPGKEEHELELLALRVQQGDLEGALGPLRQTLGRNEKNLKGWRLLCGVLRRKGETAEVQGALERMAALFPDDLSVLQETVRCHLECAMPQKAATLLVGHLALFLSAGQGSELEELFMALPEGVRAEPQVQEGLTRIYESLGDWDKLNSLRAPVLQMAGAAPPVSFTPPVEYEHHPAWEEEIDLDFDEPQPESAELPAPHGSMELEWPEEPEPFLTQEPAPPAQAAGQPVEAADSPWGELELPALPEDVPAQEEPARDAGISDFPSFGEPSQSELTFPESPLAAGDGETLPLALELDLGGEEASALEPSPAPAQPGAESAPGPPLEEGEASLSWNDLFPGCLEAEGTVDLEDAESHYDLGIAYMEMGRFDAALQEFSVAAANPRRRLDCLILQAMSHRSKGDQAAAEELLNRGLLVAGLDPRERMPLSYELASLYEGRGEVERAIPLYRRIAAADPSFRDVAQRLSLLVGEEPLDIIDLDVEELL